MMKYKLINVLKLGTFWFLTLFVNLSTGIPVDYETVTGLLPVEPQDLNDTIAAVVVDPVVKDAVRQIAANGSLNGLVVKRKVLVMPVNNPEQIISQRNQVLVVPPEHLEDVRKNITESTSEASDLDEFASAERNPLFGGTIYGNETEVNGVRYVSDDLRLDGEPEGESELVNNDDTESGSAISDFTLLPRTVLPKEVSEKVSVPIVAVIDPANMSSGKVESPIVAILPNQVEGHILKTEVSFLNNKRGQIQQEAQTYVNQNSITIDPDTWEFSSSTSPEIAKVALPQEEQAAPNLSLQSEEAKLFLTTVLVPPVEILSSLVSKENEYSKGLDDMDVAEDIIFRPLFRYRQEAAQRAQSQRENFYRRSSYRRRPYDDYDSYPSRNYRYKSRYNYDDYN